MVAYPAALRYSPNYRIGEMTVAVLAPRRCTARMVARSPARTTDWPSRVPASIT